jgi:hypothetical protein
VSEDEVVLVLPDGEQGNTQHETRYSSNLRDLEQISLQDATLTVVMRSCQIQACEGDKVLSQKTDGPVALTMQVGPDSTERLEAFLSEYAL